MTKKEQQSEEQKEKKGFSLKSATKYLREVSVVIIGVAVTFLGSEWISNRKAKNDLEHYLNAVKIELQDNLEIIKEKNDFYQRSGYFSHYLMSDTPENLSIETIDSLNRAGDFNLIGHIFTLSYKSSAFQMLITSGTMHLISDKQLFQSIMDSYAQLQYVKYESDNYMSRKTDVIYETVMDNQENHFDFLAPGYRRCFFFFATYVDLDSVFEDSAEQIEQTLSML